MVLAPEVAEEDACNFHRFVYCHWCDLSREKSVIVFLSTSKAVWVNLSGLLMIVLIGQGSVRTDHSTHVNSFVPILCASLRSVYALLSIY